MGIGAVGTVAVGVAFFAERPTALQWLFIAGIMLCAAGPKIVDRRRGRAMRAVVLAAALLAATGAAAQTGPAPAMQTAPVRDLAAQAAAMDSLRPLRGRWLGRGSRTPPAGGRIDYAQTMLVEPKAGGVLLAIEGLSLREGDHAAPPGTGSFAVVGFDERSGRYLFRSFGFGEMVEADARLLRPGVFEWVTRGPVMLRSVVDASEPGVWKERGERSSDGGRSWVPTHALTAWRVEDR